MNHQQLSKAKHPDRKPRSSWSNLWRSVTSRKARGHSTTSAPGPSYEDCLCLICRQVGHVVQSCPHFKQWELNGTIILLSYNPTHPSPHIDNPSQTLCKRCKRIRPKKFLHTRPFVPHEAEGLDSALITRRMTQIPTLGPVKTTSLLSTCPLCRFIFNITYLTKDDIAAITKPRIASDGQLALVPAWTIHRLERWADWKIFESRKEPYAKCIWTSVTSDIVVGPERLTKFVDSVADAFGLLEDREGGVESVPALRVKEVDPRSPDYDAISYWLSRCDELHHITCRPPRSEDLWKIKLVDVKTRQIVMYPPKGCDYVALSYVWGGVDQASYKLGDVLPPEAVPATLEDAMLVTGYLGKRYLWADSLCIEQGNKSDKSAQIPLMSAIYTGAWVTILNLAGQSAQSGLPRVGTLEGVIPQISCIVGGKRLLSLMPTLSQQISRSSWATRAWTFQEGLLSPRRLLFTNHQVYFECNLGQCCESLDDAKSPFHTSLDEERQTRVDELMKQLRQSASTARATMGAERCAASVNGLGVLRDPFRPFHNVWRVTDLESRTFAKYQKFVHIYTEKSMSQDIDSINAFSAMLYRFQEMEYKRGFTYGLPIEELPAALLWVHCTQPTQPRRRIDFPAWSWAGWEGSVSEVHVSGSRGYKEFRPPLRIWRAGHDGRPALVFSFNPITDRHDQWSIDLGLDDESENIPDSDLVQLLAKEMLIEPSVAEHSVDPKELLIEGIALKLTIGGDGQKEWPDERQEVDHGINLVKCLVQLGTEAEPQSLTLYGPNAAQVILQRRRTEQEFLLLSRSDGFYLRSLHSHGLLLVDTEGDTAKRVAVASLQLRDEDNHDDYKFELLAYAKPERRLFKLK